MALKANATPKANKACNVEDLYRTFLCSKRASVDIVDSDGNRFTLVIERGYPNDDLRSTQCFTERSGYVVIGRERKGQVVCLCRESGTFVVRTATKMHIKTFQLRKEMVRT